MPKITLVLDLETVEQTYTSTWENRMQDLAVTFPKMWSLNHHIFSVCHKVCIIIGKDEYSYTKNALLILTSVIYFARIVPKYNIYLGI